MPTKIMNLEQGFLFPIQLFSAFPNWVLPPSAPGAGSAHADLLAEVAAGAGWGLGRADHQRGAQRWGGK